MKKHIQFSLDESTYNRAKRILAEQNMTWQSVSEGMIEIILSENLDKFGIPLMEMALTRDVFETKIQEKFVGSMREFAFVCLAKKNKKAKWVEHKESEIERLLLELEDVFDYEIKGRWDKKKAAAEAVMYYHPKLQSFVTKAHNAFERYYGEKPYHQISAEELEPQVVKILNIISGVTI